MSWTYRVVKRVASDGAVSYGIHEAYDNGDITKPSSITVDPVAPVAETVEELTATLDRMKVALEKPTLRYDDVGQ